MSVRWQSRQSPTWRNAPGVAGRSARAPDASTFVRHSPTRPPDHLEPACDIIKESTYLGIGMIMRSGAWTSLLVCLGLFAASFDNIPDLPAIQQTVIGARISHPVSSQTKVFELGVVTTGERQEIQFSWRRRSDDHRGRLPATGPRFIHHGSDTSPPLATSPEIL